MPLIKPLYEKQLLTDLKDGLLSGINDKLSTALQDKITSAKFQKKLRVKLDGSSEWDGKETNAKDIDTALQNIKTRSEPIFKQLPDESKKEEIEKQIREITANEWSNALSSSVITWLNDEVVPAFSSVAAKVYSDVFSDTLSKVIAERTDEYLKSATVVVIIPPGTVSQGAAMAAIPNILPLKLTLVPEAKAALSVAAIPYASGGGLE